MEKRMLCNKCGSELLEGDRFCSKCGTRVTEPVSETPEAGIETEEAVKSEPVPDQTARVVIEAEGAAAAGEINKIEDWEAGKKPAGTGAADRGIMPPPCIPEEKPAKAKGKFRYKSTAYAVLGSGKKKWFPRVILGLLCIFILVLIVNGATLINFCHRTFSSPEEYYRWVERKTLRENAEVIADYYENYFMEYLHRYDQSVKGEIRVEFGDAAMDVMEGAGADMSWLEEWAVCFESNHKDSVMQCVLGMESGGNRLLTLDRILDFKDEAAYLGIPELSKMYLAVDMEQRNFVEYFYDYFSMNPGEYLETLELFEVLYKECPDRKEIEALADKYLDMLYNSIDDVKMRTGKTVRVGNISQTCTSLEIYLDKNDIQNMLTEILEELQEDEDVEALLTELFDLAAELNLDIIEYRDGDEFYEAFQDDIAQFLNDMNYNITYHNELEMTVYIDNRGRIIGRTVEFPNSWNEVAFSYVNPHRGSKFGYKGSIAVNGVEVSVTGSGREFGSKISGSFTLKFEGTGIMDVEVKNLDMNSLKKGYINGKFTVTADSGLGRVLGMYSSSSPLSDMQLMLDIAMNRTSEKMHMVLKENKELWGTLTVTVKRDKGRKISVPSTKSSIFVDDHRDFEDWWNTINWDDLIKKMEKAGFPFEAIDAVEEYSEMDSREILDELTNDMRLLINGISIW